MSERFVFKEMHDQFYVTCCFDVCFVFILAVNFHGLKAWCLDWCEKWVLSHINLELNTLVRVVFSGNHPISLEWMKS